MIYRLSCISKKSKFRCMPNRKKSNCVMVTAMGSVIDHTFDAETNDWSKSSFCWRRKRNFLLPNAWTRPTPGWATLKTRKCMTEIFAIQYFIKLWLYLISQCWFHMFHGTHKFLKRIKRTHGIFRERGIRLYKQHKNVILVILVIHSSMEKNRNVNKFQQRLQ